jgi:hypothetical protein
MPRYLFAVRHPAYAELEDDVCGMELPDHTAARELAAKVMRGLLRNQDEDWRGWTMEVRLDGRWVWHLPSIPRARFRYFQIARSAVRLPKRALRA